MCYEIVMFLEDSATDIALQDLLEMLLLMVSKVTGEKEVGPTYLASASFPLTQTSELSWAIADIVMAWIHYRSHLSLVHSHMVKQVSFLSEWFLAIIKRAMEGLLSSLSNISVLRYLREFLNGSWVCQPLNTACYIHETCKQMVFVPCGSIRELINVLW